MGWTIEFTKDYENFKTGDTLELDEMGLCLFYCDIAKVAVRIG